MSRVELTTQQVGLSMCLRPQTIPPVPEETARIAKVVFRKGNIYLRIREELGVFYEDIDFQDLYPERGQTALAPWRLATVLIMQYLENLSDRQAAEAVRARIDWKYALSLELTDPGFDFSVLSEFRDRLIEGGGERKILDLMLQRLQEKGLLVKRGKQRTDSTHIIAAAREMRRLENVAETLRYTLNSLAKAAPLWLREIIPVQWYERYGKRIEDSRFPQKPSERIELAETIGKDGFYLMEKIYQESTPSSIRSLAEVETLRQVWLQQYYAPTDKVELRNAIDSPSSALKIVSPYDIEARNSKKRSTEWMGYKVHLTETCDQELPHLIVNVETMAATTQDQTAVPKIHESLAEKDLLPSQHIVDQGYMATHLMVESQHKYQLELFGPVPINPQWQAKDGLGFEASNFLVDWKNKKVYCPLNKASSTWKKSHDSYGRPLIHIAFSHKNCSVCPALRFCTRSTKKIRVLSLFFQEEHEALAQARERQTTSEWKAQYRVRSGIEGTISQGIRRFKMRHCRYIGQAKSHLQHILIAAAINLSRAFDWLEGIPLSATRSSSLTLLGQTLK